MLKNIWAFLRWANPGLFFIYFCLFIHKIIFSSRQELNYDCRSRRRGSCPLDHLHRALNVACYATQGSVAMSFQQMNPFFNLIKGQTFEFQRLVWSRKKISCRTDCVFERPQMVLKRGLIWKLDLKFNWIWNKGSNGLKHWFEICRGAVEPISANIRVFN